MRSESGGLGTFCQTLRHGVGQQRVAADGVSRHAFFKRLRRSRRSVPMPRPANNEGQMIENAPLNVLRSLDPNVAPESAIGCNTFSPMHLSGLNAANRKTKVWPLGRSGPSWLAPKALRRAADHARVLARQTGTKLVIVRKGVLMEVDPDDVELDREEDAIDD